MPIRGIRKASFRLKLKKVGQILQFYSTQKIEFGFFSYYIFCILTAINKCTCSFLVWGLMDCRAGCHSNLNNNKKRLKCAMSFQMVDCRPGCNIQFSIGSNPFRILPSKTGIKYPVFKWLWIKWLLFFPRYLKAHHRRIKVKARIPTIRKPNPFKNRTF